MLEVMNYMFDDIAEVDDAQSWSYTDLCDTYGTFNLFAPLSKSNVQFLKQDNVIHLENGVSGTINRVTKTRGTDGSKILSVYGALDVRRLWKRVVWKMYTKTDYPEKIMYDLIVKNCTNPTDTNRKMSFVNLLPLDFQTTESIDYQKTGGQLGDAIQELAQTYNVNFDMLMNYYQNDVSFDLSIYDTIDRSSSQSVINDVVFSLTNGTVISSEYTYNKELEKNVTLVAGEGEGSVRKYLQVNAPGAIINQYTRDELWTDARDLQSTDENGNTINTLVYNGIMKNRGLAKLDENKPQETFNVEVLLGDTYVYGKDGDFYKGDVVTATDEEVEVSSDVKVRGYKKTYQATGEDAESLILGDVPVKILDLVKRSK